MSTTEMTPLNKFSYQRLINNGGGYCEGEEEQAEEEEFRVIERKKSWFRFNRIGSRRRPKLRIPGLRRFLRKKARLFSVVRIKCGRVWKRLKESKSHMGDLFAGNYLFMQVNPSSLKSFHDNIKYSITVHGAPATSSYSTRKIDQLYL